MKKLVLQKNLLQQTELRAFFSTRNASERNFEILDPALDHLTGDLATKSRDGKLAGLYHRVLTPFPRLL